MAMKKADMEAHHAEYHARMEAAQAAERSGMYRAAVEGAISAWEHIDGMMQYDRKYEDREFARVDAIQMVLKYAPLLLDLRKLDQLDELLAKYKRIAKNTSDDLVADLDKARSRIWANHRLWSYLEAHPESRQDELRQILGGEQDYWRWVAEAWEKMGLLCRTPERGSYRLALTTRMGQVVPGRCPSCGHVVEAPKAMLLESSTCPECRSAVVFVILSTNTNSNREA